MFRSLTRSQLTSDAVLGILALLITGVLSPLTYGSMGLVAPTFMVAVGYSLAFALRRLSPALALTIAWATVVVQLSLAMTVLPANLLIFAVVYATAAYGGRGLRWIGFASSILGGIIAGVYLTWRSFFLRGAFVDSDPSGANEIWLFVAVTLLLGFVLLFAWTFGLIARAGRIAATERRANVESERRRRDAENQAVALEERNRIARDMHDVVAHSLAVVIAQADGARYVIDRNPELVPRTLETISDTAREALTDVRVLLAELRHDRSDRPQPGVRDIDNLIERMQTAGLTLDVRTSGTIAASTPMTHQLAIYWILQESLTNALRHGDRKQLVAVDIMWSETEVTLTVANAIRAGAVPASTAGHGLPGMRERATIVGGQLSAHVARPGRFLVTARIPMGADNGLRNELDSV